MIRLLCMRLGAGPSGTILEPAYCETGRPYLRRTSGLVPSVRAGSHRSPQDQLHRYDEGVAFWEPIMKFCAVLLCGLTLCGLTSQPTAGQPGTSASLSNVDPDRLRAIVMDEADKTNTRAVEFGLWLGDREVLTMALGNSMTTVPATTAMHYRIGGIAETFMSTLLLMLVEQDRISLDDKISRWLPNLLAADQVTVRMLVANTAGYIDYVTVNDFLRL